MKLSEIDDQIDELTKRFQECLAMVKSDIYNNYTLEEKIQYGNGMNSIIEDLKVFSIRKQCMIAI